MDDLIRRFFDYLTAEYPDHSGKPFQIDTSGFRENGEFVYTVVVRPQVRRRNGDRAEREGVATFRERLLPDGSRPYIFSDDNRMLCKKLELMLREVAGWKDEELEQGLLMGFPPGWRDYRFIG
jgi:hypothetical protein